MFIVWGIFEPMRLYFGFKGNSKEEISGLTPFVFLSIFPQFTVVCIGGFFPVKNFPCDVVMALMMVSFQV